MKISSIILCIKTCVRTPNTDVCLYYTIIVIQLLSIVVFVCHYNFQHSRHCDNNLRKGGKVSSAGLYLGAPDSFKCAQYLNTEVDL